MNHFGSHRFWRSILVAMLVPLALIAFWPSPVDAPLHGQLADVLQFFHTHGMPAWFNYEFIEASANVILFVPVGIVAGLAYPTGRWWRIGTLGLLLSGCIEFGQLMFLHNRFATLADIVTNTCGAVIGALMAPAVLRRLQGRRF